LIFLSMIQTVIKDKIINSLLPFHPAKIILFGSYAYGHPEKNSDIDLLIILNEEYLSDKSKTLKITKLKISKALYEINTDYPIDLILYTTLNYSKFLDKGSIFSKEIRQKGIVLYETSYEGVA
jgi:uncharacterized protein